MHLFKKIKTMMAKIKTMMAGVVAFLLAMPLTEKVFAEGLKLIIFPLPNFDHYVHDSSSDGS